MRASYAIGMVYNRREHSFIAFLWSIAIMCLRSGFFFRDASRLFSVTICSMNSNLDSVNDIKKSRSIYSSQETSVKEQTANYYMNAKRHSYLCICIHPSILHGHKQAPTAYFPRSSCTQHKNYTPKNLAHYYHRSVPITVTAE